MLRKLLLVIGLVALFLPVGCNTTEPMPWSWPHNKRRLRAIGRDLHAVHMDIDRIFFDMEEYPIEVDY
jgi:hypothetical protein